MPPWLGVMGGGLTTAANAYLKALLDEPYEKEALRKAQLSNTLLTEQIEQTKANTGWLNRRLSGGAAAGRPIIRQLPNGEHVLYDPDLETFVPIPGSQARAPRTLNPQQQFDKGLMDQIETELGHPPPYTYEELQGQRVRPLVDALRRVPQIYSGPTGFSTADEIRRAADEKGLGRPPATSAPPPTTPPSSARPASPPPAPRPEPEKPAASTGGAGTGDEALATPHPKWLAYYRTTFKKLPIEEANKRVELTLQSQPSPEAVAGMMSAYQEVYGTLPPHTREAKPWELQPPGTVSPPSSPPPTTPLPPKTPPGTASASPPGGTVGTVQTPGQAKQEAERDKEALRQEEELQLKREQAARDTERLALDKLNAARQQREQDARRQIERTGRVTPEMAAMTTLLYSQNVVKKPNYAELLPQEKGLVIRYLMEPKRRKEERDALKLAGPSLDELSALDATMELTELIIPLLSSGNLGWFGAGVSKLTWLKNLVGNSAWWNMAEKSIKDEGWTGPINEAMIRARQAALIEQNDPEVQKMMSKIAPQAALQTLSSILAYTHAMAIKRTGAGTARGVIKSDMDEAHKLFDPSKFFASPDELMTNLYNLQRFIQQARPRLRERIESFHINPDTRKLMDFQLTLEPVPSGETLAPIELTPEQSRILQDEITPKGP